MQPLSVILTACSDAMRRMNTDHSDAWHADYCSIVEPASVLEMAIIIKSLLEYIEAKEGGNIVTEAIRVRLGSTRPSDTAPPLGQE